MDLVLALLGFEAGDHHRLNVKRVNYSKHCSPLIAAASCVRTAPRPTWQDGGRLGNIPQRVGGYGASYHGGAIAKNDNQRG